MLDVMASLLARVDTATRRRMAAYIVLSCLSALLDLLLMAGVVEYARLLVHSSPDDLQKDWLAALLGQRLAPQWSIVAASGGLLAFSMVKTAVQLRTAFMRQKTLIPVAQGSLRALFVQQLALPLRSLSERNLGTTTGLLVEDLRQSIQYVLMPSLEMVPDVILIAAVLLFIAITHPVTTLALAVTFCLSGTLQLRFFRTLTRHQKMATRDIVPAMLDVTNQALTAVREVKAMRRELGFRRRMRQVAHHYAQTIGREGLSNVLPRLWSEGVLFQCLFILTVVMVLTGDQFADIVPALALFAAAGWRLLPVFNRMVRTVVQMKEHLPAARDLMGRWDSEVTLARDTLGGDGPVFVRSIRLDGLVCGHDPQHPVVAGLDAEIKPGQTVAVVGQSGGGKTTLIDTLIGLLDPLGGSIEIDGRPLKDVESRWRRRIGYVPQDPYIANESVRDNVAWGLRRGQVSDQRIVSVLTAVGLEQFVADLPHGIDSRLGERGMRLSGGQRQRLCIARAMLIEPAVLILDEATSQLDLAAEAALLDTLRTGRPDLTVILATHRPQTLAACDKIIDLSARQPTCSEDNHERL